ncbi:MAG: hypothetical protein MZV70_58930 [Desulfobacterales bacterium]|nr:hypothetical protein [Desulfobacterales bacterium]
MAAVHRVIIGFAAFDTGRKVIYDYSGLNDEPHALAATNINPYLVDAPNLLISRREKPICLVPEMKIGNKPIDGG